jgi:hypothetical protein
LVLSRLETVAFRSRDAALSNLNTLYLNGIIDASTYRALATGLWYTSEFIDRQLAYLEKRKTSPVTPPVTPIEREASRAIWDTWYSEDVVPARSLKTSS